MILLSMGWSIIFLQVSSESIFATKFIDISVRVELVGPLSILYKISIRRVFHSLSSVSSLYSPANQLKMFSTFNFTLPAPEISFYARNSRIYGSMLNILWHITLWFPLRMSLRQVRAEIVVLSPMSSWRISMIVFKWFKVFINIEIRCWCSWNNVYYF